MRSETFVPSFALRNLPSQDKWSCWTCIQRKQKCDAGIPHCENCTQNNIRCRGYRMRFKWPWKMSAPHASNSECPGGVYKRPRTQKIRTRPDMLVDPTGLAVLQPELPLYGVATEHGPLLQHFLRNISRIALAIDYAENGYRSLLRLALDDEGVLAAMLAVSASHLSRWQKTPDIASRTHHKRAIEALKARFSDAAKVQDQCTITLMLLMVTYEVFRGSTSWTVHYDALQALLGARGNCSDLDPFIKSWICLIETQRSLNTGFPVFKDIEAWMQDGHGPENSSCLIDPLFGCSVRLPRLMATAARLSVEAGKLPELDIIEKVIELKMQIQAVKMDLHSEPSITVACQPKSGPLTQVPDLNQPAWSKKIMATAEIFRCATEVFVHRIAYAPALSNSREISDIVGSAMRLMTFVPDALGPGANLGWCFVVIGSELDSTDERDYIRSRVHGLHSLCINNSKSVENILEHVWANRDLAVCGTAQPLRWQDIMQQIGERSILI